MVRYEQRFCNSEFGELKFSAAEVAVIAMLLQHGAQTSGELRSRCMGMHDFRDVDDVELTLKQLEQHEMGALVVRLPPEPGQGESRYMHLFSGEVEESSAASSSAEQDDSWLQAQVESLRQQVLLLQQQAQVESLRQQVLQLQQQVTQLLSVQEVE